MDPWVGKILWRRKRLPTLVFWPGEFHGLCSPWSRKESGTTEQLSHVQLVKTHGFVQKYTCNLCIFSVCITARPNQSILKDINTEYSLEGLMLKLKYFGHLIEAAHSLEKTLMLGKIEGRWRRRNQRTKW